MLLRTLVVACLVLAPAGAFAQSTAPVPSLPPAPAPEQTNTTFRSSTDLVTLNVTVTDLKDRHVPGLLQQDFQVLEDGVPQELSFFAATDVPLDVALLVDSSSSMRDKLQLVQVAAERFLKTLRPGDRAELVTFNSQVKVAQPFTTDLALLQGAITKTVARGGTSLYTAIYVTLDQFNRLSTKGQPVRRPAIIVLTDGQDTSSLIQFDDLLERARRTGVAVYAISVVSPTDAKAIEGDQGHRFMEDSDYALKTLAKETGGRAFFPLELSELNGVYGTVASDLSTQYALGYAPRSTRNDGAFRHLIVRVLSRPDVRPRTRTGYYAARATASLLPRPEPGK